MVELKCHCLLYPRIQFKVLNHGKQFKILKYNLKSFCGKRDAFNYAGIRARVI